MLSESSPPIEIDVRTVHNRLDAGGKFVLVDCREADEWNLVRIAGAVLLPMSEIVDRLGEIAVYRDCQIAVHCHHGGRSLRVAQFLREQGYPQAQSMAGGIDQWSLEIDPSLPRY